MNLTATVLTALAAGLTLAAAIWRLIVKLGKNATTWAVISKAFEPDDGPGLMTRVARIEENFDGVKETLARIERRLPA